MSVILHLIPAAEYQAVPAGEPLRPASLDSEGFIHCTGDADTLLSVANKFYRAVPGDFLVLEVDPARVTAALRYEPPAPPPPPTDPLAGRLFPHLYGPLNREAIVAVRAVTRAPDGTFLAV